MKRFCFAAILTGLAVLFAGCSSTDISSLKVSPDTQSVAAGQTVQFSATGSIGHGTHPATFQDVTSTVTWTSSSTAIATINSTGLATAVSAGSTTE